MKLFPMKLLWFGLIAVSQVPYTTDGLPLITSETFVFRVVFIIIIVSPAEALFHKF